MNEQEIALLCRECLSRIPTSVRRCSEGIGNYVYIVQCEERYIVRCNNNVGAYRDTIFWLERLNALRLPVPNVIHYGQFHGYDYLVLSYIDGEDIGLAYPQLTRAEKQSIAKRIVQIQEVVSTLELDVPSNWSWHTFIDKMLNRAETRIRQNRYFDPEKVARLRIRAAQLEDYFSHVEPAAYLDDISSKNLIIHDGQISGIIDVDWMGIGDKLTYVALTRMALLNLGFDTDYVTFILEEMQLSQIQKEAFQFYTLLYCVDFMGERGMQFTGKTVKVSPQIIDRLNRIYEILWNEETTVT